MTFKKSMISIAAASVIAAGITGCGGSGGSGVAAVGTTAAAGIKSSVKAVDGYVMNAKVEAWYLGEDNKTMKAVTLAGTDAEKDITAGTWTDGSATYSLPTDSNSTVKSGLRFFKLSYKASVAASATSGFKPATYLEDGHKVGFDANDTGVAAGFTMYAPANSGIVSPLSNLVYQATKASLGSEAAFGTAQVDLNASSLAGLEGNATKLAAALGLTGVDLLTADPVALIATNPAVALVNALLKGVNGVAVAQALIAATAPTTPSLENTLKALVTAGANSGLADILLAQVKAGTFTAASIATLAIDKSVASGAIEEKVAPSLAGKFDVTAMQFNAVDTSTLLNDGDKLISGLNDTLILTMATKADENITNKSFNLLISIKDKKAFVADADNNISSALVISIPFDMNSTEGAEDGSQIAAGTMIKYEARDSIGSEIISKEYNATTLTLDGTKAVAVTANTLTIKLQSILGAITDSNLTGDFSVAGNIELDKISDLQVILQDTDGALIQTTNGGKAQLQFAQSTLNALSSTISGSGIRLLDFKADMRAAVTAANSVPNETLDVNISSNTQATAGTGTAASPWIVNDDSTVFLTIANGTFDTAEKNDTMTITSSSTDLDLNTTTLIAYAKDNYNNVTAAGSEFNTSSTTAGDINYTITTKVTDEFGEDNTTKYYITGNRAPTDIELNSTYASASVADLNISIKNGQDGNNTAFMANYTGSDGNTTAATTSGIDTNGTLLYMTFDMSDYDTNSTVKTLKFSATQHANVDVNGAQTGINFNDVNESNLSLAIIGTTDGVTTLATQLESNLTTLYTDITREVTLEVTDDYGLTKEANITIHIGKNY